MRSKKPAPIHAGLLARKSQGSAVAGGLQRGQTITETLVNLNFKVPGEFADRFRAEAFNSTPRLKQVQLLFKVFEAWEKSAKPAKRTSKSRA